jgi:hypothetical protein
MKMWQLKDRMLIFAPIALERAKPLPGFMTPKDFAIIDDRLSRAIGRRSNLTPIEFGSSI